VGADQGGRTLQVRPKEVSAESSSSSPSEHDNRDTRRGINRTVLGDWLRREGPPRPGQCFVVWAECDGTDIGTC